MHVEALPMLRHDTYSSVMILSRPARNPALAPFVDALWVHRGEFPHRYETLVPSKRMQLLINLDSDELCDFTLDGRLANRARGAALQGPRIAPIVINTSQQRNICGVSFAAGGTLPFVDVPASDLCGRVLNLSDLWGRDGDALRERLLEAGDPASQLDVLESALLRHGTSFERRREAQLAYALLEQGFSVHAVGERLAITPRRMIALFREQVGFAPKMFARLARFQALLRGTHVNPNWAEVASANGFADQAHMIREFRRFANTTPSQHRARSAEAANHVPLRQ
jgi:AraC-like DNA-binding protein